jgi:type IV pilus assembly protein PilW
MTTNKKGFTLIEILVSIFIFAILIAGVYATYTSIYKDVKSSDILVSSGIEKIVGLEVLRLDLEHAGFGLANDQNDKPIEVDNSSLIIRSTLNTTNKKTYGWSLIKFQTSTNWNVIAGDNTSITGAKYQVLYADNKSFKAKNVNWNGGLVDDNIYLVFPYDNVSNQCTNQFCNKITYLLSSSSVDQCASGSYNLLRKIGDGTGRHIIDCVAGWALRFDYDNNSNNNLESSELNVVLPSSATASDIKNKLKSANIYLLVQEGKIEPNFTYNSPQLNSDKDKFIIYNSDNNTTCDSNDICIGIPSNNVRWRPIILKVNFMSL